MSVMSTFSIGVDVPSVVGRNGESDIRELVSPGVRSLTVVSVNDIVEIELRVAPSGIWGVAQVVPVDAECTSSHSSPQTIVVVLSGEVLVGEGPELDGS
jgi:hypothetical protein